MSAYLHQMRPETLHRQCHRKIVENDGVEMKNVVLTRLCVWQLTAPVRGALWQGRLALLQVHDIFPKQFRNITVRFISQHLIMIL